MLDLALVQALPGDVQGPVRALPKVFYSYSFSRQADQWQVDMAARQFVYGTGRVTLEGAARKPVLKDGVYGDAEGLLLLAIAARDSGHRRDYETALEAAVEKGADVAAPRATEPEPAA